MEKEEFQYSLINKDGEQFKDWSFFLSLYTPIVGPYATALYFALVNEEIILRHLNYPRFEISRLYQVTAMDALTFNENLKKLESLKLVKSKIAKKKNLKRFELFSPLEPNEFFANEIFEKTLLTKIGPENLEALKFIFKEKSEVELEEEFEDITATFEDVFPQELQEMKQVPILETAISSLHSSKRTLFEKMLDLEIFNNFLKKAHVNFNYNSQKNKKAFNWALSLYNFNEREFANVVISCFDNSRQNLDLKKFEVQVNDFIDNKKNKNDLPISLSVSPSFPQESFYDSTDLATAPNLTPEAWAQNHLQQPLDFTFYKLLKTLKEQYHFDEETVKALLDFSCFVNEGKVIPNYLYKVADTIIAHKMLNPQVIKDYLENLKIQKQKANMRNSFSAEDNNESSKETPLRPYPDYLENDKNYENLNKKLNKSNNIDKNFSQAQIPTYEEVMNLVSKI